MKIKTYAYNPGPVSKAFLMVFGSIEHILIEEVSNQRSADLVILVNSSNLRVVYNDRFFCVLDVPGQRKLAESQPANVCVIDTFRLFDSEGKGIPYLLRVLEEHMANKAIKPADEALPEFKDVVEFKKSYSVLVIDDTERNLQIAGAVLKGCTVITASGLQEAMRYFDPKLSDLKFDAVLTDMEMRPDNQYPSLNLDRYGVSEIVPLGFAVVLEMTARGVPVAVVTDGNHHEGWVSAMFDHVKGANVNGQKVLFFNDLGKRWDRALKALLEE